MSITLVGSGIKAREIGDGEMAVTHLGTQSNAQE